MYLPARHTQAPTVWIFDARTDRLVGKVTVARCDLETVDAVARVCCAAKRQGLVPALRGTSPAFYELLDLAGLVGAVGAEVQTPTVPTRRPESTA